MNDRIENLLAQMTLQEKASLLAGADNWHTVAIERLGIPAIKVTDGPNGARGAQPIAGPTSACFPAGVALAATWNTDLVRRVGQALAEEVKSKGAHVLLAPTVNMHRSPLAGRNFECYSEDPHLASRMAVAYISGLQSQGVGACIKHFVCNDSEYERRTISSEVRDRALREIYLAPFRAAVQEAQPWAVMSAYNRVNGTYCSENPHLLLDILKGEWGFDGIVISDWSGTYSRNCANSGLDLEMPGPARWMGEGVLRAVSVGEVAESMIDDKIRRLLGVIQRAGAFEHREQRPELAVDRPEHRRLIRETAGEAIVLLKNTDGLLPLDLEKTRSIAVIGENAKWAPVQGGGSAQVSPHYVVSPLDGIAGRVGDNVEVGYEIGSTMHKVLPLIDADWLTADDGASPGLTIQFFDNGDLSGDPVHAEVTDRMHLGWFGDRPSHIHSETFSLRMMGTLTAPETGTYTLGLLTTGKGRLLLDGIVRIDEWTPSAHSGPFFEWGSSEGTVGIELAARQEVDIQLDYSSEGTVGGQTLRLGCLPPISPQPIEDAAALAAGSDIAIVFAGLSGEWESEGFDRPDMAPPGEQARLIEAVAAVNENTIVVLNTGSPIRMDWVDKVAAVVQAWYPGQEAGNAIADVLFGDVNPSGKLPTTFPKRLTDNPAYINYPGENGRVHYGEGIFVGYRYYDEKEIEPLFPFGHGLSYTTFAYRNLILRSSKYEPGDDIQIQVDVENIGTRAGQEVVQLYVRDVASTLRRPKKELKAFAKVSLEPGDTKTVAFHLDQDDLSFYDPARKRWVAEAGDFEVLVGSSSRDIRLKALFTLEA
ncbi:MAG: glycoside hydrolase family 3 C-terminal domain-containing protein [Anaerolineae bacterium]|jgi:beta-glucosidase